MHSPKISIITLSLNAEAHIVDTIKSIATQTYENIEYIIIDGGSTDSTVGLIKENEGTIAQWISEPDKGISDAMNKGLKLATGDYILFLHADDYLINPDALTEAVSFINNNADIYIFKVLLDNGSTKKTSSINKLGFMTNFKMGSCHQGQLCSRKFFEAVGDFNTDLKITMDYDLVLRAYRQGFQSKSVNLIISVMRMTGISSRLNWQGLRARFDEERVVHAKNSEHNWHRFIYKIYWFFYLNYRRVRYILNEYTPKNKTTL
jgi:glycosyltransferase involved in cell wall biosynthesis